MSWRDQLDTAVEFTKEVNLELRKVTWPKREDVVRATVMTIVAAVVLSIFLAITDFVLQSGIRPLFTGTIGVSTIFMVAYIGLICYVLYLTTKE